MKIRQVNNLSIEYSKKRLWEVITPERKSLGQFDTEEEAVAFAKLIKDFKKKKKETITTNNLDKLCEMVNDKYGLRPGDIGSVEHYQDMCENSIVQIINKSRGTRQLIFGDDITLRKYLHNILDDKVILNFWTIV